MIPATAQKVFVLGIDAMDPKLTRKYVDMGFMPNTKEIIERGSAREDLVLLGAMPTVTPPQWTTLATGAYPQTHDITGFFRQGGDLDLVNLNFSSVNCKAEQLWNVSAEAGKKTLVWHWPGSAWPPSSDSTNLHVVDGTSPGSVNMSTAQVDAEYLVLASVNNTKTVFRNAAATDSKVPCVVTGLDEEEPEMQRQAGMNDMLNLKLDYGFPLYITDPLTQGQGGVNRVPVDVAFSQITEPDDKWAAAPAGAKEFILLLSYGLIRRPVLVLKNEEGIYDRIAIYKTKKDTEPMVIIKEREYARDIVDDCAKGDNIIQATRDMRVLEIAPNGETVRMWISASMNIAANMVWHPQSLHKKVIENVGYPSPCSTLGNADRELILDCMHPCWEHVGDFQADAINYLIKEEGYEVIFSHYHAPDLQKHMFICDMAKGTENITPDGYEEIMQEIYKQQDRYISKFMYLLDEGWTIMIVSDHAQVCPTWGIRGMGDTGTNIQLMEELGFTVLKTDENGNKIPQIDWSKTKAVASREMYIYINTTDRSDHGIVAPGDRYQVEEELMTALYGYKDKESGQRIIGLALRRKDAALIGLGAPYPQGGDIVYVMAEGYEHDHDDSYSTSLGECDTSVSPIFIAAGPGIKQGFYTDRVIRQVDVTPTIATILGLRMPAQCEGAPAYQILSEVF